MTKRWIKNGVFASDTIELNGCVVCNPTEDMLRQAGYEEYKEPVPTEEEKLNTAKQNKIYEIEQYDTNPKNWRPVLKAFRAQEPTPRPIPTEFYEEPEHIKAP